MSQSKIDSFDFSQFICLECKSRPSGEDVPWKELKTNQAEQKFNRLGLEYPSDSNQRKNIRRYVMNNMLNKIDECGVDPKILDSDPKHYPSPVALAKETVKKATLHGHCHELSMLIFKSESCSC